MKIKKLPKNIQIRNQSVHKKEITSLCSASSTDIHSGCADICPPSQPVCGLAALSNMQEKPTDVYHKSKKNVFLIFLNVFLHLWCIQRSILPALSSIAIAQAHWFKQSSKFTTHDTLVDLMPEIVCKTVTELTDVQMDFTLQCLTGRKRNYHAPHVGLRAHILQKHQHLCISLKKASASGAPGLRARVLWIQNTPPIARHVAASRPLPFLCENYI